MPSGRKHIAGSALVALVALACVDLRRPPELEPCLAGVSCPGLGDPPDAGGDGSGQGVDQAVAEARAADPTAAPAAGGADAPGAADPRDPPDAAAEVAGPAADAAAPDATLAPPDAPAPDAGSHDAAPARADLGQPADVVRAPADTARAPVDAAPAPADLAPPPADAAPAPADLALPPADTTPAPGPPDMAADVGPPDAGAAPADAGDPACHAGEPVPATLDLVDDMEDLDLELAARNGRSGRWYALADATGGKQMPSPLAMTPLPVCGADRGYLHVSGGGFTDWGSSVLFDFVNGPRLYDLSAHAGLRFWARNVNASGDPVRVSLPNRDTDPTGGTCNTPAPNGTRGCYNAFGRVLVELGPDWKLVTVMFAELAQVPGWGKQIATGFDAAGVYSLQFELPARSVYDLWIDDVALIPR